MVFDGSVNGVYMFNCLNLAPFSHFLPLHFSFRSVIEDLYLRLEDVQVGQILEASLNPVLIDSL